MIGRILGRYKILDKIGAGGMGEVYRAHDSRLDRDVAVKVLPREFLSDEQHRKRMRKEAIALSRLSHPSIATIHDFDTVEGIDFLVMELVPGESLHDRLTRGSLSIDEAVRVGAELARGLAAAHDRGVIHRDLKPGNVRIAPDGRVKILDFGVAKLFKPSAPNESQEKMTDSSMLAGTLPYMSPEQIRGEQLGPASDLFSLGTILYEMVTGRHPFAAEHQHSVMYNILTTNPEPPSKLRPGISIDLERTILRLLEKDAKDRFRSGAEVLRSFGVPADQSQRPWWVGRLTPKIAVGVLGIFAVLAVAAWLREPSSAYSAAPRELAIRRLTHTGMGSVPVWSPDGAEIAYSQERKIYLIPPEGEPARALDLGGSPAIAWGWTPDSRAVIANAAYPAGSKWSVVKVGLHGETPQVLAENASFGDVSHSGQLLAYTSWNPEPDWGIWIQEIATGEKRQLVQPKGKGTATYKAKWAPDDRELSYIRWNGTGHEVWLVSSDGSNDRRIETDPIHLAGEYCWSKDSRSLIIGGELNGTWSIWQISLTGSEHTRLTASSEEALHVTRDPDGRRFVFQKSVEVSRVALVDMADRTLSFPIELDIAARCPSFSADGRNLFFQALVGTHWQIWEVKLDDKDNGPTPVIALKTTSALLPTVDDRANVIHVRADVTRTWRFGRIGWSQTLWRTSQDGGRHEPIAGAGNRVERIAPTPTRGNRILFSMNSSENYEVICVIGRTAPPLVLFTDSEDQTASAFDWGPGNADVLVAHSEPGRPEQASVISVIDVETKQVSRLFDLASADSDTQLAGADISAIALAPDRGAVAMIIVVQRSGAPIRELYELDLRTSRFMRVFEFENRAIPGTISWAPDGRRIAVDLYRERSDIYIAEPAERSVVSNR